MILHFITFSLTLLFSFSPVLTQKMDASAIFDQVVAGASKALKAPVPIPDLENDFKKGIFKGGVKATGGTFGDLSTIKRNRPATVTIHGSSATIHIAVSLGVMRVSFSHARVWLKPFSSSDAVSATVGHNGIDIQLTVTMGGGCKTTLDFAHVTDFKDIKVHFKGPGAIMNPLSNAIANHMHTKIAGAIQAKLATVLGDELKKHNLCAVVNKG